MTDLVRAPVPDRGDGESKEDAGPRQISVISGTDQVVSIVWRLAAVAVLVAGVVDLQQGGVGVGRHVSVLESFIVTHLDQA